MPRTGPRRPHTGLRLSVEDQAWVDDRAREEGIVKGGGEPNRSELIRLALAYAQQHMPKGWRPSDADAPAA